MPLLDRVGRRTFVAAALVTVIVAIGAYRFATAPCLDDPARLCVPKAGVSLVLPRDWSVKSADSGQLFVAAPQSESSVQLVIESGASVLGTTPPQTLDEVQSTVLARLTESSGGFSRVNETATDRVDLPIGSAVRLRYTSTMAFILAYNQATITDWFFVNGQLIVVEYMVAYGEGTAALPGPVDPP